MTPTCLLDDGKKASSGAHDDLHNVGDCKANDFYLILATSVFTHTVRMISTARFSVHTVWMISTARFSVGKLLLYHYKSNLAHISDLYSLVIELYKSER